MAFGDIDDGSVISGVEVGLGGDLRRGAGDGKITEYVGDGERKGDALLGGNVGAKDAEEPFTWGGIDDEDGLGGVCAGDGDYVLLIEINEVALGVIELGGEHAILPCEVGDERGLVGGNLVGAGDEILILLDDASEGVGGGDLGVSDGGKEKLDEEDEDQ